MTVPSAPTTTDDDKVLFTLSDAGGGVTQPNLLLGIHPDTLNGDDVADLAVAVRRGHPLAFGVTLSGATAQAIYGSSQPCSGVRVRASTGNSGVIYVGGATVTADEGASTSGYPLAAATADSVFVPCRDLSEVYIIGTSGDKVACLADSDT